jgi:BioD-like phosphotransacetylase family protein
MTRRVFIAATRQNDGKTTVSLGLFKALRQRDASLQYMKPVGQQYKIIHGKKIDKDAVLFQNAFHLNADHLSSMSPVASPSGFTQSYIESPNPDSLHAKIIDADTHLTRDATAILYEGTGHAGVGSVFDLSNARVAQLLKSPVIIVSIGGIGKAIDEIMLNASVFNQIGVPIMGVIINKVRPEKYDKINHFVRQGLSRLGLPVLGVIPLNDQLTFPTINAIIDELTPTVISLNNSSQNNSIENFLIGDMMPHNVLGHIRKNTVMIIPGNREGLVLTAVCEHLLNTEPTMVSGIIFTNGIRPHQKILDLLYKSHIPLLMLDEDAFSIATKINNMIVKIRLEDQHKITIAGQMIEEYVDIDTIYTKMADTSWASPPL